MALIDHITTRPAPATRSQHFGVASYLALWRSRQALSRLSARELEDIGITSEAAQHEAGRPVWDVPATWTNR